MKTKCFYFIVFMLMGMTIFIIGGYQKLKDLRSIMESNYVCTTEVNHVVFLKTHKTGGSSIQNLFMRFGSSRNLTFVLPAYGNYLGYPKPFEKIMAMQLKTGLEYNILAHHTRYNRTGIQNIMPKDTRYVTLLRNPVTLFESAFSYYEIGVYLNTTLEQFSAITDDMINFRNERIHKGKIGRNQMSFDFGMEVIDFDNQLQVSKFAEQLDNDFDLVMIVERLSESLILMKHLLCWTTFDIVVFHHNSRQEKYKKTITPELEKGILHLNKADKYLYDYFNSILDKKIEEFGKEQMELELKELKEATDYWYDYCVDGTMGKHNLTDKSKVWSSQVLGFKMNHQDDNTCQDLTKAELQFTEELQSKMRRYFARHFRLIPHNNGYF